MRKRGKEKGERRERERARERERDAFAVICSDIHLKDVLMLLPLRQAQYILCVQGSEALV